MSHRTQITLSDAQYRRLRSEAARTGLGLAELIRRALDREYGRPDPERLLTGIEKSFGSWQDRDFDGQTYVDSLRPGLGQRLERNDNAT